ncbi:hypothetical protein [Marinovum sp.]|uniref:hypothetical protein n=1 Tax=Marinovum sp. TaxID=2024839 RepID=UPI002B2773BC|nr:hypothetical protein [Marinovum sp.]
MSYRYVFDETGRLFLLRLGGRIGPQDLADLFAALAADPARTPDQHVYCDLSGLESADLNFTQVMSVTRARAAFYQQSRDIRVAVWAPGDIGFGMARMYLAMMQGFKGVAAEVFRDRAAAARFLGVEQAQLQIP